MIPGLPEGAIVDCEIRVVSYIDALEPERCYLIARKGDAPLSTYIGLLAMAQHDLIEERNS